MEKAPGGEKHESFVEKRRQEAFSEVCDALDKRLGEKDIGKTFEAHGRAYELTSTEDCMVAFAQKLQNEISQLHAEIVKKEDYREEQAAAKLLALINTYERLIELYSELRSYYPTAATRIEAHIPSLTEVVVHGTKLWERAKEK